MMRCPQCGRVFTDDALRFCLYDGQPLAPGGPAASKRGGPRALFVWAVFGVLGAVLGLIMLLVIIAMVAVAVLKSACNGKAARYKQVPLMSDNEIEFFGRLTRALLEHRHA